MNSDKPVIIFGSSRSNGNTFEAVSLVISKLNYPEIINLANYKVGDFDYNHKNNDDDFMDIIEKILKYKTIIFATPIYWYTMSAIMKRFVDRISDLLSVNKNNGRLLRNKNFVVISSYSIYPEGKDGFENVFVNTSKYLGMNYLGCYFHYSGDDEGIISNNPLLLSEFINKFE